MNELLENSTRRNNKTLQKFRNFLADDDHIKAMSNRKEEMIPKE